MIGTEAVFRLLKTGFRPCEPYSAYDHDWEAVHIDCGRNVVVTLEKAEYVTTSKNACPLCSAEEKNDRIAKAYEDMRSAGVEPDPDAPFPGAGKPWPGTHVVCGRPVAPYLKWIRRGVGPCKPCSSAKIEREKREKAAADAVAEALSYGMCPEEPFPGVKANWTATHIECGITTSTFMLGRVRRGQSPCWSCSAEARTKSQLSNKAAEVEADVRARGYTPREPYPGRKKPWSMTHDECGNVITPIYNNLLKKRSCVHCSGQCAKTCQCSVRTGRAV